MTLNDFIKTKHHVSDISPYSQSKDDEGLSGYIYFTSFYIYNKIDNQYCLVLENQIFQSSNLKYLEDKLYKFCKQIGCFE